MQDIITLTATTTIGLYIANKATDNFIIDTTICGIKGIIHRAKQTYTSIRANIIASSYMGMFKNGLNIAKIIGGLRLLILTIGTILLALYLQTTAPTAIMSMIIIITAIALSDILFYSFVHFVKYINDIVEERYAELRA